MKLSARHDGRDIPIEVTRSGTGYEVRVGDRTMIVDLVNAGPYVHSLRLDDGTQFGLTHHRVGNEHEVTLIAAKALIEVVDPLALLRKAISDGEGEGGLVKALMPGRIVKVHVEVGDQVTRGAPLLVLEAMKMENEIQAPADGTIEEIFVKTGDTVEGGTPLVQFE